MTVRKYIKKKNKLIKKYTGLTLVPKDQIVDKHFTSYTKLSILDDAVACPYCMEFSSDNCKECPMSKADNDCKNIGSTYNTIVAYDTRTSIVSKTKPWYKKLVKLINKYNDELETK